MHRIVLSSALSSALICVLSVGVLAACQSGDDAPPMPPATGDAGGSVDAGSSTDTGVATDGSTTPPVDAARADAAPPPPPPGSIPLFVALGQGARTAISCDDGASWVADQNIVDDNADHAPYAAKGLAWGGGRFVAGVGWGAPGRLLTSEDGVSWTETLDLTGTSTAGISDVVYGSGAFLAVSRRTAWRSTDGGDTWDSVGTVEGAPNIRGMAYGDYDGGRFLALADDNFIRYSDDVGATWQTPTFEAPCPANVARSGGAAYGGGVFVIVTGGGDVCRSEDGGASWTSHQVGDGVNGNVIWTGTEFYALAHDRAHRSADGRAWTTTMFNLTRSTMRRVARSDDGAYVAAARDGESFYRSADGDTWTELPPQPGTDIVRLVFGHAQPSAQCPAP